MRMRLLSVLLALGGGTGCAATLSDATRHDVGVGIGLVAGDDQPDTNGRPLPDDGIGWTVHYAVRVCDRCDTFQLHVEVPLVVNPRQSVRATRVPVPDARSEVFVIPNARFSISVGRAAFFAGFGGGVGHFTESARLTTGDANTSRRRSTRAVVGVHPGFQTQVSKLMGLRLGLWVVGPRAALSFPSPDPDCTKNCGDMTFAYLASAVFHF